MSFLLGHYLIFLYFPQFAVGLDKMNIALEQ